MKSGTRKFPTQKKLETVRKKLSKRNVMGSSILPGNANEIDRAKHKACEMIIRHRLTSGIMQKELAHALGIDESRMSEILHYKIEGFTLERLIGYMLTIYPNLKIDIKAA